MLAGVLAGGAGVALMAERKRTAALRARLDVVAGSGRQALEIYRAHGDTFDLILMDVQMPDMDGRDDRRGPGDRSGPPPPVPVPLRTAR